MTFIICAKCKELEIYIISSGEEYAVCYVNYFRKYEKSSTIWLCMEPTSSTCRHFLIFIHKKGKSVAFSVKNLHYC